MSQKTAKQLAEQFFTELEAANRGGPDALYAIMNKWYDASIEQYEAGEQPTKGLEAVIAREKFFFENYFDWTVKIDGPTLTIHSLHGDDTVTYAHQTYKGAFKGAGLVTGQQLVEQHWDVKSGKIVKEVFWHVKK